ncbi:MAG TPA: peroxiredoxin family protein [Candidatus Bacteroides intestinavium]|uniref:Peroxiredoxin family protein n=1 Tax=Candidatus Bacteroides intestinavium TaxID=2838469 RepID=A0A9D2HR49_9BACE|nr:peroxiredoxin family protein [Candidatus Bacteroides intestinavium]
MRHVKWIFVVLLISSLISFVNKDKPMRGLNVGDIAPDFDIQALSPEQHDFSLSRLKGKYVLLSFWASYDAPSRMCNAALSEAFRTASPDGVEMVSISFDEYESIFKETVRKDQIVTPACFVETDGEASDLYKMYQLGGGFTNYLLDENGIILAKDISAKDILAYLN